MLRRPAARSAFVRSRFSFAPSDAPVLVSARVAGAGPRTRLALTAIRSAAMLVAAFSTMACSGGDGGASGITTPPAPPPPAAPSEPLLAMGQRLFDLEAFGGNGRTCVTCHMRETGTITLEAVAARLLTSPADPLFLHDGLDAGAQGTSRILREATIRVELKLPPSVTLVDNPTQRTIVVNRGVPTTINAPALDGASLAALMVDLRNVDLQEQARDAILGHAKGTVTPTREQLDAIAAFEQQDDRFFSSSALHANARGGPRVELPQGTSESEKRGRLFFLETGAEGTTQGMCGGCHGGPMLNEITALGAQEAQATGALPSQAPLGAKFANARVSERNAANNPLFTFRIDNGAGDVRSIVSPDPGIMLTERQSSRHLSFFVPAGIHPALFANFFKTPSLWGIKNTPPYFHDNSAKTLRDVADHYGDHLFKQFPFKKVFNTLTEQERIDIVAYLNLL